MAIDLAAYLRALRAERQPTCVVHALPHSGLSAYARALARQPSFTYLDVLGTVASRPELAARVDRLQPAELGQLVMSLAATDMLLVDEIGFLFPVWGRDVRPFQEMVRTLHHPTRVVAAAFFVHTRPEWEAWPLHTAARASRVLAFHDLQPVRA